MSEQENLEKMRCIHLIEMGVRISRKYHWNSVLAKEMVAEPIFRCELDRASCAVCPDNPKNKWKDMK